jgi:L-histidine Nalpha-methyltransferase
MHLVARSRQDVHIDAAEIEFAMRKGERIWTESSYKYRPDEVADLLGTVGFAVVAHWLDRVDRFALTLTQLR